MQDDDYPREADIKAQTKVTFSKTEELLTSHPDGADYNGKFYCVNIGSKNWYAGTDADKLWNTNEGTSDPVSKSDYDPCPDGWRVPTKVELEILKGTKTALNKVEGTHGTSTVYGSKFDGINGESDNYVFLPISGFIDLGGSFNNRGNAVLELNLLLVIDSRWRRKVLSVGQGREKPLNHRYSKSCLWRLCPLCQRIREYLIENQC